MSSGYATAFLLPNISIPSAVLEIFGTLGLIMIVLEGSLDLTLSKKNLPLIKSAAIVSTFITLISVTGLSAMFHFIFHAPWLSAVLYAIPFSIVSSAIAIPSVAKLHPEKREFIIYESTISDIIGILLFNYALVLGKNSGSALIYPISFVLMLVISLVVSLGMIFILGKMKKGSRNLLTLGVLIILYESGKLLHLSSLVLILLFGLLFNNLRPLLEKQKLRRFFHPRNHAVALSEFKSITSEAAFFIRTLFFFSFGISIKLLDLANPATIISGLITVLFLYLARWIQLKAVTKKSIMPEILIAPRGLITILLFATIPAEYAVVKGLNNGLLLFVILSTNIVMALALIFHRIAPEDCDTDTVSCVEEVQTID